MLLGRELALLRCAAGLGSARGVVGGPAGMPGRAAALPALGDDEQLVVRVEGGQKKLMFGVEDQRAGRQADDQVLAAQARHLLAHAGLSVGGAPVVLAGEIEERVFGSIGGKDDGAPIT